MQAAVARYTDRCRLPPLRGAEFVIGKRVPATRPPLYPRSRPRNTRYLWQLTRLMTRSSRNCTINANAFTTTYHVNWVDDEENCLRVIDKIIFPISWPSPTSSLLANRLKINYNWFQTYALIPTYNQKLRYITLFYRHVITSNIKRLNIVKITNHI